MVLSLEQIPDIVLPRKLRERGSGSLGSGEDVSSVRAHEPDVGDVWAFVQLFAISAANPATANTFLKLREFARPLGATMILFGFVVLIFGLHRFFAIQRALTKGVFPVTRLAAVAMTITLSVLVLVTFGVLVSPRARHSIRST